MPSTAGEVMARRSELFDALTSLDHELQLTLGRSPSNRATAVARKLLGRRVHICNEMSTVGYQWWGIPADADETKVSSG